MYNDLKNMLKAYSNGDKKVYQRGDWKIAEGGYDLWFEIYYKDILKVQCIDGELEVGNSADIDSEKVLQMVKEILTHVK
jgi:hypothetical protein